MNGLTIFDIPFAVVTVIPFLGAGAMAWAGYLIGQRFTPDIRLRSNSRLDGFIGGKSKSADAQTAMVGSKEHRIRIAFAGINVDAAGSEEYYMTLANIAAGAGFSVILMLVGLPFFTSLVGFIAGRVFVNGWVVRSWNKVRADMESELPSLLLRLSSTLQTTPNVPSALEMISSTLKANGPLRQWAIESAARMHSEGYGAIEAIRLSAAGISTSLSIATELIGRVWTTGGEGYAKAFGTAADNLESVLDARVEARARGSGAQGTVNILTAMTFGMIGFMMNSDALAESVDLPIVQILYAAISLAIVYGHRQVSELIDSVV